MSVTCGGVASDVCKALHINAPRATDYAGTARVSVDCRPADGHTGMCQDLRVTTTPGAEYACGLTCKGTDTTHNLCRGIKFPCTNSSNSWTAFAPCSGDHACHWPEASLRPPRSLRSR